MLLPLPFNLENAVGRGKDVQDIGVHREFEKFVVTLLVMRSFSNFLGASRACAYFRDPTAFSRFNGFNTNTMQPTLIKVIFIHEAVANIEVKIIDYHLVSVVGKEHAADFRNTVIFAIDMKRMKIVILPALANLDDVIQAG